jgi:Protein of unknown function (DUF2933)
VKDEIERTSLMWTIRTFLGSKVGFVLCLLLAAAGAYLLWNHTGHFVYALPYVLLLACPLMHLFGHGHHHHHADSEGKSRRRTLRAADALRYRSSMYDFHRRRIELQA